MSCKECVHSGFCYLTIRGEGDNCEFKNKNNLVEVVRCKDCRYRIHDEVINEWFCNSDHSGFVYTKPNDFCSYGERKDND